MFLSRAKHYLKLSQIIAVYGLSIMSLAHGAISLDFTIKPGPKSNLINKIEGMAALQDGSLVTVDSIKGTLVIYKEGKSRSVKLSGRKIFSSNRLGGVGIAGENQLAISNISDGRIAIIDLEGNLIVRIAKEGSAYGQIEDPHGVAYSVNRRVYVADTDNNRVTVFGSDGVFLHAIGKQGIAEDIRLDEPVGVFVDYEERVYVFQRSNYGTVSIFSHSGKLLKRLDNKQLQNIVGGEDVEFTTMTVDKTGLVYLADSNNGRVFQIDWQRDKKLNAFGSKGGERGQFRQITSLAVMNDGRVAVADSGNKKIEIYKISTTGRTQGEQVRLPTVLRYQAIKMKCDTSYRMNNGDALCMRRDKDTVKQYNSQGKLVKDWGKFSNPSAAAMNGDNIVIIDGERLKIYSSKGEPRFSGKGYGGDGSGEGKLDSPKGVYIKHGQIYVADTDNQRIQIFSKDGIYLDKITNLKNIENSSQEYFSEPTSVVVDSQGNIYVADTDLNHVLVFSKERKFLYKIGGEEEQKDKPFDHVYDIAMDIDNNLYVLCSVPNNKYTIQVYSGPKKVISFAAFSGNGAGILEATNLTVAQSKRAFVGVYDKEKKALLNYSYLQVPAKVGGLKIVGSEKQSKLMWQAVPGNFVAGYNVFGASTENGDYEFVSQVTTNEAILNHDTEKGGKAGYAFYKVNTFSGLGSVGKFSRIQENVFMAGFEFYQKKQYEKVIAKYQKYLQKEETEQPDMLKYLGLSQLELKQTNEAVISFQALGRIKGYEAEALNLQIKGLVAAKDYIAAKAIIDKVIEQNTAETDTYIFCGELSLKMGDAIGAITCLEEAIIRDDKNIDAHFFLGDAYVKLGVIDQGLAEFDKAAAIAPDNADVWYRAGLIMQQLNKNDVAIERLNKALEIDKKHPGARLALAQSYLLNKEFDKVKNIAISLAGEKDTAAEGQYLLGQVSSINGKNGLALLAFIKATRLDPKHAKAWLALAEAYVQAGQTDKYRPTLVKAVTANPLSFEASFKLGMLDFEASQYENAAESLRKAVNVRTNNYEVRIALATALYKAKDYKKAIVDAKYAAKLKPNEVAPIVLLSDITNKEGKIGKSIDYMKQAMEKKPNSVELYLGLGSLYIDNNLFDQAKTQLEKAALLDASSSKPHFLLGQLYLKRRIFDKAISALDKAVNLEPSAENKQQLDAAYAEKKKSLDFKSNAPQIVLKDLHLDQVFSAAYKQYTNKPVGRIRIQNTSGTDYGNLKLTFAIKGYMDYPTTKEISKLGANSTEEIDLLASFNNRILEIDEDTGVQVEVALHFVRDGRDDAIKLTQPMTIYGKNAIVWGQSNMVGSFVTPKDDTLRDFVRQAINESKPEPGPLNANIVSAMTLFDVLTAHGIRYVVDPNNPYTDVQVDRVDYVQFGRETLKIKSGDCDDLSVLLSAGLENLGVQTAILDVPGHLLMMFNTKLSEDRRDQISLQDDLMIIRDGEVWIPIEATMIGTSFAEAWAEGARKYYKYEKDKTLKVTTLKQAWSEFLPVTLKPASYSIGMPEKSKVSPLVEREKNILLQKSLDRLVKPYEVMAAADEDNISALMQVAIIYAKYGLINQANKAFDKILKQDPDNSSVRNNRGNIYYSRGDYGQAIETYSYAEQLAANDPGIKVNLAMSHYQLGQLSEARDKFEEATTISSEVEVKYAGLGKLLSR